MTSSRLAIPSPTSPDLHCGVEFLGEFNGINWQTRETSPREWHEIANGETIEIEFILRPGNPPTIEGRANGATVVYTPGNTPPPVCD